MSQMKIKIVPHTKGRQIRVGREVLGLVHLVNRWIPEGGEEKTIKGHACHELTTTVLAVAP